MTEYKKKLLQMIKEKNLENKDMSLDEWSNIMCPYFGLVKNGISEDSWLTNFHNSGIIHIYKDHSKCNSFGETGINNKHQIYWRIKIPGEISCGEKSAIEVEE